MQRLGSGADIVVGVAAVEGMIVSAEEDEPFIGLTGSVLSDARGTYRVLEGVGEAQVGLSMVSPEGGTDPDDDMLRTFSEKFGDGVLVVVDPYAGEFAFYIVEGGRARPASAVMSG